MFERFLARVGTLGAILILALAVIVVGFGGGVVEHLRLAAAQNEQQGEQSGTQGESQEGDQGKSGSQKQAQSGKQGQSQEGENSTQAGQTGEQGDNETESKAK